MLTQPRVQRYSNESGLRDIMIADKAKFPAAFAQGLTRINSISPTVLRPFSIVLFSSAKERAS